MPKQHLLARWLRDDAARSHDKGQHHTAPWYATLWLTGVDYFSSLGYAPGLALMAAGYVAPLATLILVLVTFLAAVPVYAFVAKYSSDGEGSIKMIERLTTKWGLLGWLGKTLVLVLLGFAMTDFVITITLSAADATHHLMENPLLRDYMPDTPVLITAVLIVGLCLVFLKGFKEAIGLSVLIALPYMVMNAVIIGVGIEELTHKPELIAAWWQKIAHFNAEELRQALQPMSKDGVGPVAYIHGGGAMMLIAVSLLVFPKLALGMSGFETGVSVMPHISAKDTAERVRNTRKLLFFAALLMSIELLGANFVSTLLIPPEQFWVARPGVAAGAAQGRALAYLAHELLGTTFGTVYDLTTVLILWFAGASAMAGLLGIIPRYLPRFGMSPMWLEYRRPLVLVITGVCLLVNWVFQADVEAQGGAYATGVLVLMASGAFAVLLAEREKPFYRLIFTIILAIFGYVLVVNTGERPDGVKIASLFIAAIIVASIWSRWRRASELRVGDVQFTTEASRAAWEALCDAQGVVLVPLRNMTVEARRRSEAKRMQHAQSASAKYAFLNVELTDDPSAFATPIMVNVKEADGDVIVEVTGAVAIANAIAFVALKMNADQVIIGLLDNGTPAQNALLYLLFGTGEVGYAVRSIFVRVREERLADQYVERKSFDEDRDRREKNLLRDAVLMTEEERHTHMTQLFEHERSEFETRLSVGPKMPRLILYD